MVCLVSGDDIWGRIVYAYDTVAVKGHYYVYDSVISEYLFIYYHLHLPCLSIILSQYYCNVSFIPRNDTNT